MKILGQTLLIALVYVAGAKAGFLLAINPGNVTLVWPPSGIGLAAVLLVGGRALGGVWLGAFVANLAFYWSVGPARGADVAISMGIATASAAQAWAIAYWLHRRGLANGPTSVKSVMCFVLVSSIGCTVASTGGTATLVLGQKVAWAGVWATWGTWWLGDLAGIFFVTPLASALLSSRRRIWAERALLLLISGGVVFSLSLFVLVLELAQQRSRLRFEGEARDAVAAIQRAVDDSVRELEAVASLYRTQSAVDREQFALFVAPFLKRSKVIKAVEWLPLVESQQRGRYEAMARTWSPGFRITERSPQGGLVAAADRPEYFPVFFVEPLVGNEQAVGFDIASEPVRREALDWMRKTRHPAATAPIRLVQEKTQQKGFLIFWPVETREGSLQGAALGVFRAGDLIEGALALARLPGLDVSVVDADSPSEGAMYSSGQDRQFTGFLRSDQVEVAGRRWTVRCSSIATATERVGVGPWFVLVGGLGFTALMAVYFAARVSAEERLRKAHDELAGANQNLAAKTKELEASLGELGTARAQLLHEEKLKSVGRLAAGIAHEINTPVQFVSDSVFFVKDAAASLATLIEQYQEAHIVLDGGGTWEETKSAIAKAEEDADLLYIFEKLPRAIARSLDGIERVTTIVRSMKEFAHPDQKDMAAVDLNHSIKSTLTIARNEYKYVADVKTDFGEIPPVTCYAGELNQAILNIIVNASHAIGDVVKAAGGRGTIDVRTRKEDDSVLISISDTGGGIPREIWNRIYDPFFTTKEVGRGTGQGLAIARAVVVEKHGGDLRFETEPGKGTTFFIRLPIAGQKGQAPEGKA